MGRKRPVSQRGMIVLVRGGRGEGIRGVAAWYLIYIYIYIQSAARQRARVLSGT